MIITKNQLGDDSPHFIKQGYKSFTPDYFIKIKDKSKLDFIIKDSDCIFFIVESGSFKPVGVKSVDSLTYEELKTIQFEEFSPEFVYVFSKNSIDIEKFKETYLY